MWLKNYDITIEDCALYVPETNNWRKFYGCLWDYQSWEDRLEKVWSLRVGRYRLMVLKEKPAIEELKAKLNKAA